MRAQGGQFGAVVALQQNDGLQTGHGLLIEPFLAQLGVHVVEANLVELVDGDGNIDDFLGCADDFGNATEDFPVVEFHRHPYAEAGKHLVDETQQFHFVEEGVGAHHVGVALEKFAVTPLLRTVGPPHGLYLITFEGKREFAAVHDHETGKGHGEVITQTFLAEFRRQAGRLTAGQLLVGEVGEEIARVQHLEEQFVTLFAVFSHEGREVLHGRRLYLLETEKVEYLAYRIENIVAFRHLFGRKVPGSFGYGRFCCHYFCDM